MHRQAAETDTRTLAALTGYAVTTVSRALANDPRIAQSTRDAVARAAAEIGYIPDRAAQRLRTGRTQVISLVLDPHSEILGFSGSMIAGIAEGLRGTRYHISITQHALEEDPMRPILHIVRNQLADGIIFSRTRPQDERVKFLLAHDFPFVTHGRTEIAAAHPVVRLRQRQLRLASPCGTSRRAGGGASRSCRPRAPSPSHAT